MGHRADDVRLMTQQLRAVYPEAIARLPDLSDKARTLIEEGLSVQARQLDPKLLDLLTAPGDIDARRVYTSDEWMEWATAWLDTLTTLRDNPAELNAAVEPPARPSGTSR